MKLRLYKSQMRKALLWYENTLSEKYARQPLTPATVELINRDLVTLQQRQQHRENNPVWQVPVGINIDYSRHVFNVVITDDSNLLYLDFDKP